MLTTLPAAAAAASVSVSAAAACASACASVPATLSKPLRGFALMKARDPERFTALSRQAGQRSQSSGRGHRWASSEEATRAARLAAPAREARRHQRQGAA